MPIKKSELYSSLWSSCDELRGGMDASQYKDYVLVLLFIKYVSDKYAGVPYALTLSGLLAANVVCDFVEPLALLENRMPQARQKLLPKLPRRRLGQLLPGAHPALSRGVLRARD